MMKAVLYEKYGPPEVLEMRQVERPQPKEDEVLVKIHAATVTSGDVRLRSSDFPPLFWLPARLIFGLFRPKKKILGHEFSGSVEEVGKNVSDYKVGDHVFGTTTMLPTGSYAEYVCIPRKWKHGVISQKPENLDHQKAAALPIGAMTAMFLLEKGSLKEGQKVLVYGASGSVGSYAIQIAKNEGAEVTAVCSSSNFEMVKSLGAHETIDYKTTDYTQGGDRYDVVFDAVGKTSKSKAKRVLKSGGSFVSVEMMTQEKEDHLKRIKTMAEKGVLTPFIVKTFPLEELVEAHRYVSTGRKRGNVVIDVLKD